MHAEHILKRMHPEVSNKRVTWSFHLFFAKSVSSPTYKTTRFAERDHVLKAPVQIKLHVAVITTYAMNI